MNFFSCFDHFVKIQDESTSKLIEQRWYHEKTRQLKKIGKQNELLNHLINEFDNQKYKDIGLANENYIVVGQLCLDKSIRGMGYVEKIYSQFKKTYKRHRYCLTAVDLENKRSSAIHQRCGFLRIGQLMLNENPGEIILWDLTN